jgi:hypothetical protein
MQLQHTCSLTWSLLGAVLFSFTVSIPLTGSMTGPPPACSTRRAAVILLLLPLLLLLLLLLLLSLSPVLC